MELLREAGETKLPMGYAKGDKLEGKPGFFQVDAVLGRLKSGLFVVISCFKEVSGTQRKYLMRVAEAKKLGDRNVLFLDLGNPVVGIELTERICKEIMANRIPLPEERLEKMIEKAGWTTVPDSSERSEKGVTEEVQKYRAPLVEKWER